MELPDDIARLECCVLTATELSAAWGKLMQMQMFANELLTLHSRHDNYLPLNLWDSTPDE